MDKTFIEQRYSETAAEEPTSNLADRCRVIASMIGTGGRLLDVGCWDGSVARTYAKRFLQSEGSEIHGVDFVRHPEAVRFYREVYEADISHVALPVASEQFDTVVISEVIEHVFDTDFVLGEIYRVLKKSGVLVITAPNLASIVNRLFLLLGYQPVYTEVSSRKSNYGNPWRRDGKPAGHIRDFTLRALSDLVRAHGFSIERTASVPIVEKQPFALLERVAGLVRPSLGGNTILKCRKP